ncbi:inositol-1-monophosphatase [Photobacterium sp. SDRW27]|uniref:3'(2'),5'-bisphosphate nucleotidase CysQ family protein n=1 Tax=Photobacterium obscurum TaxID=2829490 RepID=UPI0022434456|nr:inositol monophosphatase family protein [Photobacterium obscurum]MCW8330961.1 inositol-1-monophosphatase [Photobacterium obscurum]
MTLSPQQLQALLVLATEAASKAGQYIAAFDRSQLLVDHKAAGNSLSSQVVTQVDLDSQAIILDVLAPSIEQYDIAVLSEENASEENVSDHSRFQKAYFWCIDPLDGTLPFIEGSDGFAVSIALVEQSGKPVIGVVHNPVTGDTYQAINFQAILSQASEPEVVSHKLAPYSETAKVLKNGLPWQPKMQSDTFTLYIDRSFENDPYYVPCIEMLETFVRQQGYSKLNVVNTCGAVMNAIGVLENAPACYLKLPKVKKGGGSLWDFAATAAITQACLFSHIHAQTQSPTRVWVSDSHGAPLDLNRLDSNFMNHKGALYVSGAEHEALLRGVSGLIDN